MQIAVDQRKRQSKLIWEGDIMFCTKDHVFHSAAVAASDGAFFDNSQGFSWLTVDIDGSPTSFNINFEFTGAGGVRRALKGMNKSDWSSGTSTATSAQTWDFDIKGCKKIYMDLSAITAGAGSITVKGIAGGEE